MIGSSPIAWLAITELEAAAAAGAGRLKYFDGATWQTKTLKYWDGAAWTTKTLKYWNGSAWTS